MYDNAAMSDTPSSGKSEQIDPVAFGSAADPRQHTPAWLRRTEGETKWGMAIGVLAVIGLQTVLPDRFAIHPRYLSSVILLVGLISLLVSHPGRMAQRSPRLRMLSQVLFGLMAATNVVSVALLVRHITSGHPLPARELLLGGAEIWLANVFVFALWYWEYDRGGPANRANGEDENPDLLFPQMTDEKLGRNWEPIFVDYLFVAYTNSTAFSPTDTMPLSRWAKVLFMVQSAMSFVTVGLILARAVNILPGG
jgi:hypothetical protein